MIITEFVNIKTHTKLKKYYENLGYDMSGEFIDIKVTDLPKSSHILVKVKCDVCDNEKYLVYDKYNKNIKNCDFYACSIKCSEIKRKNTFIKNYNCDHPLKNKIIQEKIINTCLERYGETTPLLNEEIKEKICNTNIERYGVKSVLMLEENRKKMIQYFHDNKELIIEKRKNTNLKLYKVEHPTKNDDIKNKIKNTNIERCGVSNGRTGESLNKFNETILDNFIEKHKDYNFLNVNYNNFTLSLYCDDCENNYDITFQQFKDREIRKNLKMCTICNPIGSCSESNSEKDLKKIISNYYKGEIIKNDRKILKGLELDIFLPDKNIAFEYNGILAQ